MHLVTRRALRFARAWLRGPVATEEVDTKLDRGGTEVPATLLRPAGASGRLPGWVVLHGSTVTGRAHPQLGRFTRALVSSGAAAIIPEVPEWRALRLAPHLAEPTLEAGVRGLRESGWVVDEPVGVIGFSFGAPHAIAATAQPRLTEEVACSVGFGGYCDIETTFRYMMIGPAGARSELPDPYGRWIVASNYLTTVPEYAECHDVTTALRDLALHSGEVGNPSWDPAYDPVIAELRAGLPVERRKIFDLFALPSGSLPDPDAAARVAELLAVAARASDPTLDPVPRLRRVRRPVHIVHGRRDRLIPASEAHRLRDALPPETRAKVTVTGIFGHSAQDPFRFLEWLHEAPRFLLALSGVLRVA